jgi:hypothetical protein
VRFPVFIRLRRSNLLAGALCAMHAAVACAFLVMPWPLPLHIGLLAALAASLARALRPPPVASLRLYKDGALECLRPDGQSLPATPLADTAVFSWLVALRLDADGQRISLPLFPDHMSRDEFRMLRLWLRWSGPDAQSA